MFCRFLMFCRLKTVLVFLLSFSGAFAQQRWQLGPEVGDGIVWHVTRNQSHSDHIELSGQQLAAVLRYGVRQDGSFALERSLIWPLLRTIPNDTHGSFMQRSALDLPALITVNGAPLKHERVETIAINGLLDVVSRYHVQHASSPAVQISRTVFPSTVHPVLCEAYSLVNFSEHPLVVSIPDLRMDNHAPADRGVDGTYVVATRTGNAGVFRVAPGDSLSFSLSIQAHRVTESPLSVDVSAELAGRNRFLQTISSALILKTPDPLIDELFRFSKIRASESIFKTKGGYMHGPGGESYYAAIWANDQAEYVNPMFPYIGYSIGNQSAMNSFAHFGRFMNPEFKPIPSSIIAEGTDIWNGAGDRGDAAMIGYGAARYALANGNLEDATALWPLIEWCLAYCKRQLNAQGVVASDSDELEGRFPAGDANLTTSCLYYDALLSAYYLGGHLQIPARQLRQYKQEAAALRRAIESHFGFNMHGFETYRYYAGNDLLRSWIAIPLTVGIYDRVEGTVQALFSDRLWSENGLLTQEGSTTYWDRSTLYALRGAFAGGATEKALFYLQHYAKTRLTGEHVPYPIEAWPEGNQRHLSAESGLYVRIITEGLFGIRPTGLRSFALSPRLPADWPTMELNAIKAFGGDLDVKVSRVENKLEVTVSNKGTRIHKWQIKPGDTINVSVGE